MMVYNDVFQDKSSQHLKTEKLEKISKRLRRNNIRAAGCSEEMKFGGKHCG
jgi:hypothetical protein